MFFLEFHNWTDLNLSMSLQSNILSFQLKKIMYFNTHFNHIDKFRLSEMGLKNREIQCVRVFLTLYYGTLFYN